LRACYVGSIALSRSAWQDAITSALARILQPIERAVFPGDGRPHAASTRCLLGRYPDGEPKRAWRSRVAQEPNARYFLAMFLESRGQRRFSDAALTARS